jgi:hypothetical protein
MNFELEYCMFFPLSISSLSVIYLWQLSFRQILMNFYLEHFTLFSLSFFSLCVIYPREKSFIIKTKKGVS